MKNAGAMLHYALREENDEIIGVLLSRKTNFETIDALSTIDLTDRIEWISGRGNGKKKYPVVNFDLPEGEWTLSILTVSYKGGEKRTEGYLNPVDPEAVQILLDTVYQPIYEHFSGEFGKTILGFFSDEPRFGNIHGSENASIGRNVDMDLPWRDGLEKLLSEKLDGTAIEGADVRKLLLLLFLQSDSGESHVIQYVYMDLISRMYSENFDGVIASWCEKHSCRHIGHMIEDNNAVARLGYGAGHFFRAMEHQDMVGIDVVMHQLIPGMDRGMFKGMHKPGWDGEFFTYVLGKLGRSPAELNPRMQGQCMCEIFEAYGWSERNRLCKWLADHMLVRGINYFVPHAFDPAPFPDSDCPPHFWAHGHNPQYTEFPVLVRYMNRMAELLSGGEHVTAAAVLFHAEAEWSGEHMLTQKPAAELARRCIDYSIVPAEYVVEGKAYEDKILIRGQKYGALIIPYAEALPMKLLSTINEFAKNGGKVYLVDGMPKRTSEGLQAPEIMGETVALHKLAERLISDGIPELTLDKEAAYLRYFHISKGQTHVYFFTNEGLDNISARVAGAVKGNAYVYDAFSNLQKEEEEPFQLEQEPYMSKCIIVMEDAEIFQPINALPGLAGFAGRIRYQLRFELTKEQAESAAMLSLYGVREGAAVSVNGAECGRRICAPYDHDVSGSLKPGENFVVVEVNSTLGRKLMK